MERGSTKQKILDAALDLFSTQGFEATSIAQIAEAVGIRKASLYSHFASKQAILDAIVETVLARHAQHSIFARQTPPVDAGALTPDAAAEMILGQVLGEFDVKIDEKMPVTFSCDCSKDRVRHVLSTLQMSDLESLAADNKPIDIACNFCGKSYRFDAGELREIVERRKG